MSVVTARFATWVHSSSLADVDRETPVADYFCQFPGLDSGDAYNGAGFWELPVPVVNHLDVEEDDLVIWDDQGYDQLRDFLKGAGIRHCLMMGASDRLSALAGLLLCAC